MIFELVGGQFINQGAALMVRAVVDRVRQFRPQATFAIAPGPWAPPAGRLREGALLKLPLRKGRIDLNRLSYGLPDVIYRSLVDRHLVLEGMVNAALDLSGYAYGERWGSLPLEALAARLERARRHGRPYVFLPQAFGPFEKMPRRTVEAFGWGVASAAYVAARDLESVAALEALKMGDNHVTRVPDLTIGYPGDLSAGVESGVDRSTALIIPNIRMLDSASEALGWRENYFSILHGLVAAARIAGFVPRVLNHSGREDRALAESLGISPVIEESDPVRTKGIVGTAGLVISSRYHGCVSALSQGVPCIATSWSHKYQELFDDFGLRELVLIKPDCAFAIDRLNTLIDRRSEISRHLRESSATLASRVEKMWQDVFAVLSRTDER